MKLKSRKPRTFNFNQSLPIARLVIVTTVVVVGTLLVTKSHAATPAMAIEAESGVATSLVNKVTDVRASAGQAVQFGAATCPAGQTGTPPSCVTASTWPDASNTGYAPTAVTLTNSTGMVVSTPGAVIDSMNFTGQVYIAANNVTIKRSKIKFSTQSYLIRVASGVTGTIIQDVEVDGDVGSYTGIYGDGLTIKRVNIHNVENGMITSASTTISDSYIHDLLNSGSPHYDGVEINGGTNISIIHNTISIPNETGTVNANNYFGPVNNILIDNNKLLGGTYTIYVDGQFTGGPITNVTVTNNRIGGGVYGYGLVRNCTITQSGNVDNTTGAPVQL